MLQEITQFINQHPVLGMTWLLLLIAVIILTLKSSLSKVKEITRNDAVHLINKENALVIDIRNRDDYRKGHIANSLNLTATEIKNAHFKELEKNREKPMIVVCTNGISSRTSAESLFTAGFNKVFILKDGITGWSNEHLPLSRSRGN